MTLLDETKYFIKKYKIKPNKLRGQNFLISENVLEKIIEFADLKKDDVVLEVGTGFGILTRKLSEKVKRVISLEVDKEIFQIAENILRDLRNIELLNEDALKFDFSCHSGGSPRGRPIESRTSVLLSGGILSVARAPSRMTGKDDIKYKIVANLPYGITSRFLKIFLTCKNKPSEMILLVQKEVAERICVKPGAMSLLSLSAQFYGEPEILMQVPADNFLPAPKVDSALIKIKIKENLSKVDEKKFWQLARVGFSSRRRQLQNNLSVGLKIDKEKTKNILRSANLDEQVRAQELSVDDWIKLENRLKQKNRITS